MKYIFILLVVIVVAHINSLESRTETKVVAKPPYKVLYLTPEPKPDPVEHDSPEWLKELYK